jgi:hypothetical protein
MRGVSTQPECDQGHKRCREKLLHNSPFFPPHIPVGAARVGT